MRAFVAVPLESDVRRALTDFQRQLGCPRGIKRVPEENLHLTLDFLGDISDDEARRFTSRLADVAERTACFPLTVSDVGGFPRRSNPKILWVGLKENRPLLTLATAVKTAVDSMDEKDFSPHLTLGRVKYEGEAEKMFIERFFREGNRSFGRMKVDRFLLMKSDLSGKTPVYTVIHEFLLKDGDNNGEKNG